MKDELDGTCSMRRTMVWGVEAWVVVVVVVVVINVFRISELEHPSHTLVFKPTLTSAAIWTYYITLLLL
jgi:hypothetical protein